MKRSKGLRVGTRKALRVRKRERGKISINSLLKKLDEGDRVVIKPRGNVQKTIPKKRFFGLVGVVKGRRGSCYEVSVKTGGVTKTLIISPAHLKRV